MTAMRCLQPPRGAAAVRAEAARADVVPELETARLRLRAPRVEDCALWTAIWQEAPEEYPREPVSDEHAWEEFCVYCAGWLIHGHGLWSVEAKAGGALLGFVLLGLEWGDEAPELGWAFAPEARGQGYAPEAAAAARDFALGLFGPGGVVSYIYEANGASIRVAEKLGAHRAPNHDDETRVYRHGLSPQEEHS